jgi:hypothetical protein
LYLELAEKPGGTKYGIVVGGSKYVLISFGIEDVGTLSGLRGNLDPF